MQQRRHGLLDHDGWEFTVAVEFHLGGGRCHGHAVLFGGQPDVATEKADRAGNPGFDA